MFNLSTKETPSVHQIKAIIDYMEKDQFVKYDFSAMMGMKIVEPNKIALNLDNGHVGSMYEILFDDKNKIIGFDRISFYMS